MTQLHRNKKSGVLVKGVNLFLHRTVGDKLGEAKASGNLGNTLKVLGKFEEAIACCQRHLDLSKEIADKVSVNDFTPKTKTKNHSLLIHQALPSHLSLLPHCITQAVS